MSIPDPINSFLRSATVVKLALLLCLLPVTTEAGIRQDTPSFWEQIPVPDGARVTLKPDKKQYFIGEDVVVQYVLENTGTKPFKIRIGGDYCADSRHFRFFVKVQDESGKKIPDPLRCRRRCGHGRGKTRHLEIKPGEKYSEALTLSKYFLFENPGTYTIRVSHDLGWKNTKERKRPVGEVKVKFLMPPGKKVVLRKAPTPESTKEIVGLMNHPQKRIALSHASELRCRLPDPKYEIEPRNKVHASGCCEVERSWMAENSWSPEFSGPALEHAKRIMSWRDLKGMEYAAFIIACLGGQDEMPTLIEGLDYVLAEMKFTPYDTYSELITAAEMLVCKGVEAPVSPRSPGEAAVFLTAFASRKDFRPQGWETTFRKLLKHRLFYIRQLALKSIPRPVDNQFLDLLVELLGDSEFAVVREACTAAEGLKNPELKEPIINILSNSRSVKIIDLAIKVAKSLSMLPEALLVIAARLDEKGMEIASASVLAYNTLQTTYFSCSGKIGFVNAEQLKKTWVAFINNHKEEIRGGRKFSVSDAELTPDLIPEACRIFRKSGEAWPPVQ